MQLGDSRAGKFFGNLAAFGRALRRAGVPLDSARMALAADACLAVGLAQRDDVSAALEAVLVSREQDRMVFRELFDAFFRDPDMAQKLLSQLLPGRERPSPAAGARAYARPLRRGSCRGSCPSRSRKTTRWSSTQR